MTTNDPTVPSPAVNSRSRSVSPRRRVPTTRISAVDIAIALCVLVLTAVIQSVSGVHSIVCFALTCVSAFACCLIATHLSDRVAGITAGLLAGSMLWPAGPETSWFGLAAGLAGVVVCWACAAARAPNSLIRCIAVALIGVVAQAAIAISHPSLPTVPEDLPIKAMVALLFSMPVIALIISDRDRRRLYLPFFVWILIPYASLILPGSSSGIAAESVLPVIAVLVGAGFSRLIPALTGENTPIVVRYSMATAAVLILVAANLLSSVLPGRIRSAVSPLKMEAVSNAPSTVLPTPSPILVTPGSPATIAHVAPTPHVASMKPQHNASGPAVHRAALTKIAPKIVPKQSVPVSGPAKPNLKKIVTPGTKTYRPKTYYRHRGVLVRRSKWAINWDLRHPHR